MDITPLIPKGRQLIQAYGDGGFTVSGTQFAGSVLIFPETTLTWPVTALDELTLDSLRPVLDMAAEVQLLLVGTGTSMRPFPSRLRAELRSAGLVVDSMDTGAAARTYNVLLAEERRVAAALIAV